MKAFEREYKKLNPAQRQAVDHIDGPMLVIAGPGTGKTQLLSMRVANILRLTDISPANILCLTFTDNAARNMRERLESIIGQPAYHVFINTFHGFGIDVINRYPDFFTDRELLQQIDELGSYELLRAIFEDLPHGNPLSAKVGDEFIMLNDTLNVISWLKQNAVKPAELHDFILANTKFMDKFANDIKTTFASRISPKLLPGYKNLLESIKSQSSEQRLYGFADYGTECALQLEKAIETTTADGRYAPRITEWRNRWCLKNAEGEFVFKDSGRNMRKMHAIGNIYEQLLEHMSKQGLYDFDDMIMEVVHALETNSELKANLQERYQYILVDEFQDTNKAQLRILQALADNPIFENRPNIMAVGDDDQAIYAFQGAEVSNMAIFTKNYRDPELITLSSNYRSSRDILETSYNVASQISDRLESVLKDTHKKLIAELSPDNSAVKHAVLPSELAQYDWIAEQTEVLLKKGAQPEQIAVIAPRHRYLERLIPYMAAREIPVAYERRENILDAPIIKQLLTMAQLILAIADNRQTEVDALLSEVIGYDFWNVPSETILDISLDCYNKHSHWLPVLSGHKNKYIREITSWFLELAKRCRVEPLEYILDKLFGALPPGADNEYDDELPSAKKDKFVSPMRQFYFSQDRYNKTTDLYLATLGQLSTLRQRLRQWKPDKTIYIEELIEFVNLHRQAHIKIVDTNPHTQTTNAVQIMTAYKAKGLEFETVFIINAQDEVWGTTARSRSSRITLPANLTIEPVGDNDNDKLRLLYVALTRAKKNLFVTSYTHDLNNRLSPALSFISEERLLKPTYIEKPVNSKAAEILATDWAYRFRHIIADKPTLFEPILSNYKLSVTHLNNFTDIVDSGPQFFLLHNLLRFPQAPTPNAAYGDVIHKTLQWLNLRLKETGKLPSASKYGPYFTDLLERKHLKAVDFKRFNKRGIKALRLYLELRAESFNNADLIERGFNNEGVVIGGAHLSGKIDKITFDSAGQVKVIDFKTGKPAKSWQGRDLYEKVKLHKYRQQLLFYKLLVENSASFSNKLSVTEAGLDFIEADDNGKMLDILGLTFDQEELNRFTKLITAVWQHINDLNFPDTTGYSKNLKGIQNFEQDLIEGKI